MPLRGRRSRGHPPEGGGVAQRATVRLTRNGVKRAHPVVPYVRFMTEIEETGTIDWFLIEAHDKEITGELVGPLLELVDRRLIRILDVLVLVKRDDDFDALTSTDLDIAVVGDLGELAGASSGVLTAEDANAAAAVMTPNSIGLCIVYENLWSIPFGVAARKAGGQLVASGHIPTQALVAALDALDA